MKCVKIVLLNYSPASSIARMITFSISSGSTVPPTRPDRTCRWGTYMVKHVTHHIWATPYMGIRNSKYYTWEQGDNSIMWSSIIYLVKIIFRQSVILINIIKSEQEPNLALSVVEFCHCGFPDWTEGGQ